MYDLSHETIQPIFGLTAICWFCNGEIIGECARIKSPGDNMLRIHLDICYDKFIIGIAMFNDEHGERKTVVQ